MYCCGILIFIIKKNYNLYNICYALSTCTAKKSGIEVWLFGTNAWQCRMVVHITIFVLHSAIR